MNIALYIARRLMLARKRSQLRGLNNWIFQVTDQIESGKEYLAKAQKKASKLEAEILALEPPDEIARRGARA